MNEEEEEEARDMSLDRGYAWGMKGRSTNSASWCSDVCFSVVNSVVLYKQIHCQNRREAGCCGSDAFYSFGAGVSLVSVASIPFHLTSKLFIFLY